MALISKRVMRAFLRGYYQMEVSDTELDEISKEWERTSLPLGDFIRLVWNKK